MMVRLLALLTVLSAPADRPSGGRGGNSAAPGPDAPKPVPAFPPELVNLLGPVTYEHESSVKLYPDERRAGVKNGRAGYVAIATRPNVMVKASIYMDVEQIDVNGEKKTKKTYRMANPKGVSFHFTDANEEKRYKTAQAALWAAARVAKATASDATGDDAGFSELE